MPDINEGKPWSQMDDDDLRLEVSSGKCAERLRLCGSPGTPPFQEPSRCSLAQSWDRHCSGWRCNSCHFTLTCGTRLRHWTSALGHSQTLAPTANVSVSPPKADISLRSRHVRDVPLSEVYLTSSRANL
jgi:hypothetical protein